MKVTPSEAQSSANAGSSATKPQPTQAASARGRAQGPAELLVVEVGVAGAGLPQDDGLVGGAHERRPPLGLRVQGDDPDAVAVLGVELAYGADEPHRRLAPVDHRDPAEHRAPLPPGAPRPLTSSLPGRRFGRQTGDDPRARNGTREACATRGARHSLTSPVSGPAGPHRGPDRPRSEEAVPPCADSWAGPPGSPRRWAISWAPRTSPASRNSPPKHGDGWGVARTPGGGSPSASRTPRGTSAEFARWAEPPPRRPGPGAPALGDAGTRRRPDNTHPFTDGRVAFAHNGSIRPPAGLGPAPVGEKAQRRRRGDDGQRAVLPRRSQLLREGAAPEEALRTTADLIAASLEFTSLNCLLLTPEKLYALCRYDPAGRLGGRRPLYYDLRYRVSPDAVVVASSGWGSDWRELANGDLLVVRRRTLETSVVTSAGLSVPA